MFFFLFKFSKDENEKVAKIKNEIQAKEEEHKFFLFYFNNNKSDLRQQILHIETLGMMTKYQLVFIKLETSLHKVSHILSSRKILQKTEAFYSILNYIKLNEILTIYKRKMVANRLKKTLINNFLQPLSTHLIKNKSFGFYKIYEFSKIFYKQRKWNEELNLIKNENSINLVKKEQDLKILNKKSDELAVLINELKMKENEYSSKIKMQDQIISSLQQDSTSTDQIIKKNTQLNEGSTKVKLLEQKALINK